MLSQLQAKESGPTKGTKNESEDSPLFGGEGKVGREGDMVA